MTRQMKCEVLKSKRYTYNSETGKIFNRFGKEISNLCSRGYVTIEGNKDFNGILYAHHYAWYWVYGNVDFEMLDHINRIKIDNRIVNLRISNTQKNSFNTNAKGYYFDKSNNKWRAIITIDGKKKHLGRFNTEEEAKQAYLNAKTKYHNLN